MALGLLQHVHWVGAEIISCWMMIMPVKRFFPGGVKGTNALPRYLISINNFKIFSFYLH